MKAYVNWKKISIVAGLILIALYPVLHGSDYIMHIINICFLWAVVAASWDLIVGYAGILSIGNIAFFVIGGYFSGILAKTFGVPVWACPFLGGIITMVIVTVLVGLPSLRLGGIYIALWSYMFAAVLPPIIAQTQQFSGGSNGLNLIPQFIDGMTRTQAFYVNYAFFLTAMGIIYKALKSTSGLAFLAMRDSLDFATSLGVNIYREKLKVFALSSLLTGIAGGFYVHYMKAISPALLGSIPFTMVIAMILIGGIGRFPGAVIGTFLISFTNEYLRLMGTWRLAVLGAIICLMILYFPGGFMEVIDRMDHFLKGRKRHRNAESVTGKDTVLDTE
jgi:branched-chain amino acid transport system permease protein